MIAELDAQLKSILRPYPSVKPQLKVVASKKKA
jgi:hypothetical protein